jgi:hypothetical protein
VLARCAFSLGERWLVVETDEAAVSADKHEKDGASAFLACLKQFPVGTYKLEVAEKVSKATIGPG